MMKKLDERGVAALEFALVAVPFFTLMFVIFDLGRYAITVQSLHALADAEARAIMIGCYTTAVTSNPKGSVAGCTTPPITSTSTPSIHDVAPFLDAGGPTTVGITAKANALTITTTQTGFTAPFWGTTLNAPSASTSIPF